MGNYRDTGQTLGGQARTATFPGSKRDWEGFVRWLVDFNRFHFPSQQEFHFPSQQEFHFPSIQREFHLHFPSKKEVHISIFHLNKKFPFPFSITTRVPFSFSISTRVPFSILPSLLLRCWVQGPRAARQSPAPSKQLPPSWLPCRKPTSGNF